LEYLGRVVFNTDGLLYPDSLVGTDSHTTMINGLGILGWGMNLYMKIFNKYIANLKLKELVPFFVRFCKSLLAVFFLVLIG
jgi:hypothetical protein